MKSIYTHCKKAGHLNIKTKMASKDSQRVFTSQSIRICASKLFLCYGGLPFLWQVY